MTIKQAARRFNVIDCGRRFGKDVLGIDRLIEPALRGYPVGWFAPIYKDMLENWREIRRLLSPVIVSSNRAEGQIELITGGVIDLWSLNDPDSGRGRKYRRIIVNEAAKVKMLRYSWDYVLRPTLADYQGDAWIFSTPKGLNDFYGLYQMAEIDQDWQRWKMPTSANPFIAQSEIDDMRRSLPEQVFQQEIEAEFIENGSYFQNVTECAVIEAPDKPDQHKGHTVVMGVDWGKSNDWTVITVGCRQCGRVVDWQRFNQIDYHYQRGRLREMAQDWQPLAILPERNSIGDVLIEELIRDGLPIMRGPDGKDGFNTTALTKADLIEALHMALVRDGFKVPKDYADELRAYEIEIRSGPPKFGAPDGLHDDRVMSLALCWRAMLEAAPAIIGW